MITASKHSPRARRRRSAEAGFTLIETMIAGLIFTIGALALAFVIPFGVSRITKSGQQTGASELATQRTEYLLTLPHGDALMTSGSHDDASNPYGGNLYASWTIEDGQPETGCKRISLSVRRGSTTATVLARTVVVSSSVGSGS